MPPVLWGFFIQVDRHSGSPPDTYDYVSVDFGFIDPNINTIEDLFSLSVGSTFNSFYDAIYTTTTSDPGYNVEDYYEGLAELVYVDNINGDAYVAFPQDPLPGSYNLTHFEVDYYYDIKMYNWSPSSHNFSIDNTLVILDSDPRTEPVPEPVTMFLLGTGLVGVAGAARRKKKNQA
jgi:hypothetical protein